MNKSYKEFLQWIGIIINTLISVSTALTINYIQMNSNSIKGDYAYWVFVFFSIIPIVIVSKTIIKLFELFLAKSEKIRKFVAGKFFIEGYWVQSTYRVNDAKTIVSFAVIKFSYHDSNLTASGDAYKNDDSYSYVGNFRSTIVEYDRFNFIYAYKGNHFISQPFNVTGHGKFVFSEAEKTPVRYTGYFQDTQAYKDVIYIKGEKITDKKSLNKINEKRFRNELLKHYAKELDIEKFEEDNVQEIILESYK